MVDGINIALLHQYGFLIRADQHCAEWMMADTHRAFGDFVGAPQMTMNLIGGRRQTLGRKITHAVFLSGFINGIVQFYFRLLAQLLVCLFSQPLETIVASRA